jgi:hypothetical protein
MTAGKVSFWGPKEEPVCCERCVSAARSLPGWLFGGCKTADDTACKTADDTPGAYEDTTPPPVRFTIPRPSPFPSGDTDVDAGNKHGSRTLHTPWILHQYSINTP